MYVMSNVHRIQTLLITNAVNVKKRCYQGYKFKLLLGTVVYATKSGVNTFFGIPRGSIYPNEQDKDQLMQTQPKTVNINCDYIKQINTNKY